MARKTKAVASTPAITEVPKSERSAFSTVKVPAMSGQRMPQTMPAMAHPMKVTSAMA